MNDPSFPTPIRLFLNDTLVGVAHWFSNGLWSEGSLYTLLAALPPSEYAVLKSAIAKQPRIGAVHLSPSNVWGWAVSPSSSNAAA